MNENTISKMNFLRQLTNIVKSNLKNIIIFLSLCFVLFLSFQIYSSYSSNKIKKNSIVFFKVQNLEDITAITDIITKLSNQNNFYGILSKLELIKVNLEQKNNQEAITLYFDILNNKNLDPIYKSAIASRATYQFIDLNFSNLSLDYSQAINDFITYINDELVPYQSTKLELVYLTKILEVEKNNIEYKNFKEVNDMYNSIISSEVASSAIKERVNKIHEFFSNK